LLAKAFPHVRFPWLEWIGDEIVIAICRQQLRSLERGGITKYEWLDTPCACMHCQALARGGPYPVGSGPLPVLDSHSQCMCIINGVVD